MTTACPMTLDKERLEAEVYATYSKVAADPGGEFHFHRGPQYAARLLGYDLDELEALGLARRVRGGAIALGHPLGCTGAKLTSTLLHEMRRRGVRYGICTMCVGGGMGAAGVIENLMI